MTPTTNPLMLPEIVRIVLQYLDNSADRSQLVQCAQVNKLWADEAIRLLWAIVQADAPLTRFAELSVARQRYYANKVRVIYLSEPDRLQLLENIKLDRELQWPLLSGFAAFDQSYSNDDQVLRFLGEKLQIFCLRGGVASDTVIYRLPERCPHIFMIWLSDLPGVTAEGLLTALKAMPSISFIALDGMDQVITTRFLHHLANREGLRLLHLLVGLWPVLSRALGVLHPISATGDAEYFERAIDFNRCTSVFARAAEAYSYSARPYRRRLGSCCQLYQVDGARSFTRPYLRDQWLRSSQSR